MIADLKAQRRALQPEVFSELRGIAGSKYTNELSLNAFIGSKSDEYVDLRTAVVTSPLEFRSLWLAGLKRAATASAPDPRHSSMYALVKGPYPKFKEYLAAFLEGSFLKHYEEHQRKKPKIEESEYWFGNNADEFGLLVTPRYVTGTWENDKSEIRHFPRPYWTIAHVMETGLCYMGEDRRRSFSQISDYLQFFRDIVRRTKSRYQLEIADRYAKYVQQHRDPLSVPLLIPELRYDALKNRHKHRLDFLIINPWSLEKYGFEFSPWSTHGQLHGANRAMAAYNEDAKAHFETEMMKHKKYWRRFGVAYVIYTDTDLADMGAVWEEIRKQLEIPVAPTQLEFALLAESVQPLGS